MTVPILTVLTTADAVKMFATAQPQRKSTTGDKNHLYPEVHGDVPQPFCDMNSSTLSLSVLMTAMAELVWCHKT